MSQEGKQVSVEEALEAMRRGCRVASPLRLFYFDDGLIYESGGLGHSFTLERWTEHQAKHAADRLYVVWDPQHPA